MPNRARPRPKAKGKVTAPSGRSVPPPAAEVPSPPPPQAPISANGPDPEAVGLFEHAMEAMQRHAYRDAARGFQAILGRFPNEGSLLDRSRVYLALCEREAARKPQPLQTVEERVIAATAALNNGDIDGAERLAKAVLATEPRHDLALYLLAVVETRMGMIAEALSHLGEAIALSPEAGAQARFDSDFDALREHDEFWRLTDPPTPSPPGAKRSRRGRSDR